MAIIGRYILHNDNEYDKLTSMKHLQENKRKQMLHFHYYSEAKCNAGSLFLFRKRRMFF